MFSSLLFSQCLIGCINRLVEVGRKMAEKKELSSGDEGRPSEKEDERRPARRFSLSRRGKMILDRERKDLFERDLSQLK